MNDLLDIILKWAVPTILTALCGYVTKGMKENKKDNKAMKQSMMLMLRSQIVGKVENYMKLGYLPDYARSCLEDLFRQYTVLGGNHGVEALVEQCFSLPPIPQKKKGSK